ncbi:MAG: 3-deoxy-D-manno-octulosonic acid transferase [Gammaproteobacteria bacterium]|nr:3-deoxy-D-manno-octulosonic acid transferase [Gammaproteobacteria bacterium]
MNRSVLLKYNVLLWVLSLPLSIFTLGQALRRGGRRYAMQRLGWGYPQFTQRPIWLHAASVGEVIAALPLLERLRIRFPSASMLVTTATPTGATIAATRLPSGINHAYLPIDWHGAVRRFIRTTQPRCALIMETELWPNLYARCNTSGIPLVLVNGRLSARTLRAGGWVRGVYHATLAQVTAVLARSETDRAAFVELGAAAYCVSVAGNIKFSADAGRHDLAPIQLDRPYLLAASTHHDEELQLARLWQDLALNDFMLVIAPRHPHRAKAILGQLATLRLNVAVRSRGDTVTAQTAVYLADTLGELPAFIRGSALVFMGGSLVPAGGHNILEPARAGKAVVFGPHMRNFTDEARTLLSANAAVQVRDVAELGAHLTRLLNNPQQCCELGQRAQTLLDNYADVADRYLEAVVQHCHLDNHA